MKTDDALWYALYVKQRYEKIAATHLASKGYEVFLPTYQSKRRWSDRTKVIEFPLFAGYAFCKFDFQERLPILTAPGVNFIVGFGKTPTPVNVQELDAVRAITSSGLPCEPWPFLKVGHSVRVEHGPLANLEGFVLSDSKAFRLVISVNLLGRSVAVEIDREAVRPIAGLENEQHSLATL